VVSGLFSITFAGLSSGVQELSPRTTPGVTVRQDGHYVGSHENQMVRLAVESLRAPDPAYNPIYFCGPTGTGKTLLARGIAEQWQTGHPDRPVQMADSVDFARAYANAVDTHGLREFRDRYRHVGLLVVDDLHQIPKKLAAQQELARTVDAVISGGGVVIATSNTPLDESRSLVATLRSRLAGGLVIPLTTPGREARVFLLKQLAAIHELQLDDDAVALLTERLHSRRATVPELNHVVVQLAQVLRDSGKAVDADRLRAVLTDVTSASHTDIAHIAQQISRRFGIPVRDLRGPRRLRHIVRARGAAMYLAWHLTQLSLEAIGKYFGKRDHTTVLHACRRTAALRATDAEIDTAIRNITRNLESP